MFFFLVGLPKMPRTTPAEREDERVVTCGNILDVLATVRLHIPKSAPQFTELQILTDDQNLDFYHRLYNTGQRTRIYRWLWKHIFSYKGAPCLHTSRREEFFSAEVDAPRWAFGSWRFRKFHDVRTVNAPTAEDLARCKVIGGTIAVYWTTKDGEEESHAMAVVFYGERRVIELIDSNGVSDYTPGVLDALRHYIALFPHLRGWSVEAPTTFCPRYSAMRKVPTLFQEFTGGSCTIWASLWAFMRSVCYELTSEELSYRIISWGHMERANMVRNFAALEWQILRYYVEEEERPTSLKTIRLFGMTFFTSSRKTLAPGLRKIGSARGIDIISVKEASLAHQKRRSLKRKVKTQLQKRASGERR